MKLFWLGGGYWAVIIRAESQDDAKAILLEANAVDANWLNKNPPIELQIDGPRGIVKEVSG